MVGQGHLEMTSLSWFPWFNVLPNKWEITFYSVCSAPILKHLHLTLKPHHNTSHRYVYLKFTNTRELCMFLTNTQSYVPFFFSFFLWYEHNSGDNPKEYWLVFFYWQPDGSVHCFRWSQTHWMWFARFDSSCLRLIPLYFHPSFTKCRWVSKVWTLSFQVSESKLRCENTYT